MPDDPADSVRDDDCDGLANLHEFWHGTDPHAPDDVDTALAVLARSVDARLAGKAPATALPYFLGYPQTAPRSTKRSSQAIRRIRSSCCSKTSRSC